MEPDILGRAYEYLLRKFAEGQGSSAGEFFTPPEVGVAHGSDARSRSPARPSTTPTAARRVCSSSPTCGCSETTGEAGNGQRSCPPNVAPLKLFGQEINPSTFAMARMNAFIHDMEAEIALGDTMHRPRFTQRDGRLRRSTG